MNTDCILFIQTHSGPKKQLTAKGTQRLEREVPVLYYLLFQRILFGTPNTFSPTIKLYAS